MNIQPYSNTQMRWNTQNTFTDAFTRWEERIHRDVAPSFSLVKPDPENDGLPISPSFFLKEDISDVCITDFCEVRTALPKSCFSFEPISPPSFNDVQTTYTCMLSSRDINFAQKSYEELLDIDELVSQNLFRKVKSQSCVHFKNMDQSQIAMKQ